MLAGSPLLGGGWGGGPSARPQGSGQQLYYAISGGVHLDVILHGKKKMETTVRSSAKETVAALTKLSRKEPFVIKTHECTNTNRGIPGKTRANVFLSPTRCDRSDHVGIWRGFGLSTPRSAPSIATRRSNNDRAADR